MRRVIGYVSILFGLLLPAGRAHAHTLGAECKLSGDKVEVEAYYDDDSAARDAKVQVEDSSKKIVVEGRTDKNGRWPFPRPQPGRYVVVVDAGSGHRTQVRITIPQDGSSAVAASSSPAAACKCCDESPGNVATPPSLTVSDGPDRREFTKFPWLKVGIGLSVIGGLGLAFFVSRRMRPPTTP